MSRAEDLFHRILKEGERSIDDFIEQRVSEELFLDFKRSSNNGEGIRLSQNDRNNFAKAISGFGNSEGGIIVWGIDCSRLEDGSDVANAKYPIVNVTRFKSWLDGAISGCTIPPHTNVINEVLKINEQGGGYVISFIPKSNHAPHQVVGRLQYYMRAGSDFVPVTHSILAGMFGKRPQPNIINQFTSEPVSFENSSLHVSIGIMLMNNGIGIADNLFLNFTIFGNLGPNCKIKFQPINSNYWRAELLFGMQISMVSQNNYKLPPEARTQPLVLVFNLEPPFNNNLKMQGLVGGENSPSTKFDIEVTGEQIAEAYGKIISKKRNNSLTDDDLYDLSNLLTGQ